jgi:hypothetical protein
MENMMIVEKSLFSSPDPKILKGGQMSRKSLFSSPDLKKYWKV